MLIPKILLLFVPMFAMVESQYNSLDGSQSERIIPHRRPLPRNTWMRSPSNSYRNAATNNALETPSKEPEISVVYPESYTNAPPSKRPIWSGINPISEDRLQSNEPKVTEIKSNPTTESHLVKEPTKAPVPKTEEPHWQAPKTTPQAPTRKPTTRRIATPSSFNDNNNDVLLNDYDCKRANGYEAVPNNCEEYVECNNNNAYRSICTEGLHFDAKVRFPSFPCAPPSQAKCKVQPKLPVVTEVTEEPESINTCPKPSGYFPLPLGDCSKFILCQNGEATEMSCPPGLAYRADTSSCDWPVNVPGCNPETFKGFTCPKPVLDESGEALDLISKHKYKNSCKNYIACLKGYPRLLSCDDNFSFNAKTNKCVKSEKVKNCEN